MGELQEKRFFNGRYSSNKVADIDTELSKMREIEVSSLKAALLEKDVLVKKLEIEVEKGKESEKKLIHSLEEIAKEISYHSQDSSQEEEDEEDSDIEMASEASSSALKVSELLQEMKSIKNELKSATDAEITSKKAMDDLALALKEVATDCNQTKEKLVIAETELESARLFKNTSERLRIEAEESLIAWNGKESVFVNCIKKGEDEKNSLLDENNRLLEALVVAENQNKKAKEENHKVRDILKQAISEANVAKETVVIVRAENSNLKEEIERVKVNEALANENVKKLKKLLSEVEEEKQHRQDSTQKKMIGKSCSFSLVKLAHNHNHKHKESVEEESSEANSPDSDSNLFKGSIFDVAETPHEATTQTHHKRRSSCTFLEEGKTINQEDLENLEGNNHLEEEEFNEKAVARKKKAFIRRFGDLLVRKKSFSFSHKKESSTDSTDKQQQQQPPQTPTSPSPPQLSPSPPEP